MECLAQREGARRKGVIFQRGVVLGRTAVLRGQGEGGRAGGEAVVGKGGLRRFGGRGDKHVAASFTPAVASFAPERRAPGEGAQRERRRQRGG